MGMRQSRLAVFALGAAVVVLSSLGLSASSLSGRGRADKADKVKPPGVLQEKQPVGVAERPQAVTEEGDCACEGEHGHGCCSGAPGACTCCQGKVARSSRSGVRMLARAEEDRKDEGKKDEKKMASAEAKAKGVAARKATVAHQKALMEEDVYDCCIKPGCAFCSNAADMCPCAKNLRKGGPVCPECWGGWQAGKGRLSGVKAADVKVLPKEKLKMMYDMRSKSFEKAEK